MASVSYHKSLTLAQRTNWCGKSADENLISKHSEEDQITTQKCVVMKSCHIARCCGAVSMSEEFRVRDYDLNMHPPCQKTTSQWQRCCRAGTKNVCSKTFDWKVNLPEIESGCDRDNSLFNNISISLEMFPILWIKILLLRLAGMVHSSKRQLASLLRFIFIFHAMSSCSQAFELKPTILSSKQAVVGHSVHLPCEFPYLASNPALILWYKNHNSRPFYSYDAREMVGGQHKVHDQFDLGRRANFSYKSSAAYSTKNTLGYLVISNVTLKDAGNFTCRVDYQKAQTTMVMLQLEVHEPIWRLSVVDVHEREVGRETAPYEEGKRLYLICRAYRGFPPPTVRWIADRKIIATSLPHTSDFVAPRNRWKNIEISSDNMEVEAVLQLPALRREDQGRSFTCQANNSKLAPVRTKIITLNMSLRPIHIEIEGPSGPLWSGKEAQFHCRSWGSRPPAKLQWGPESLKMLNYQNSVDNNITVSRAQLIPTPDDDGISINCTAVNPNVRSYSMSTVKKLSVYYAPRVEVQLASVFSANKIKEGEDIFFECKVRANPKPRSLIWLHEGEILREDKEKGILVQPHNLVLQKVSRNSRGKYQCKATNNVSTVTSEPVYLKIMFVPECSESQNKTVLVSEGEEVLLNCSVVSYPQPTEFIWRLNGSNGWQNIDSGKISSHGLLSSFSYSAKAKRHPVSMFNGANLRDTFEDNSIREINYHGQEHHSYHSSHPEGNPTGGSEVRRKRTHRSDSLIYTYTEEKHQRLAPSRHRFIPGESYGVVYCLARNSVGKQKEPCIFHISPAGPPGDLKSCSFANQSATTLRVTCEPGHGGGLKQSFRAMALDHDSKEVVANVTSARPEFYLKGLIPGKDYVIIVTAFNSKGSSVPFLLECFALKVAENKIKDENGKDTSPLVNLFLGVISGFLLVVAVLVLATRARYKRRRANASKEQNIQAANSEEKDPLSPSSNPSMEDNLNEDNDKELDERDPCLQVPDITAQTPDSIISISTLNSEKHGRRLIPSVDEGSQSSYGCSTPPPLLGLSNTYARIGGLPRASSNQGFTGSQDNVKNSNLPRHPKTELHQTLPSVDLTKVSSNVNKYYTLKINCTRQNNESFV